MEWLNQYSGLFSLLALLAAIVVPIVIYRREKNDSKKEIQAELDAMEEVKKEDFYNMCGSDSYRQEMLHRRILEKKLKG